MIYPDTLQLNRVSWRIAAGLAAAFALMAVLLHQGLLSWIPKHHAPGPHVQVRKEAGNTLKFASVDRRVTFCAEHVTPERCFVVFENGTCVIVDEPAPDPIGAAKEILSKTAGAEARFITRRIEDGRLIVTYREPVFHCLFSDEISRLEPELGKTFAAHLSPSERQTMPAGWTPPFDAQLGLLTRTNLNRDAASLKIAKVVRSQPLPDNPDRFAPAPVPSSVEAGGSSASLWRSPPPAPLQVSADDAKISP